MKAQLTHILATAASVLLLGTAGFAEDDYFDVHPHVGQIIEHPPRRARISPNRRLAYDYSQTVTFGGRTHLDALSADLKYRANAICWEMYRNYRTNPGFRPTYRAAFEMLQEAKHIYRLVYNDEYHLRSPRQKDHIAADLAQINALFHQIEQNIANWRADFENPYHPGNLHNMVEDFEQTLHHVMQDYGVKSNVVPIQEPPIPSDLGVPTVP